LASHSDGGHVARKVEALTVASIRILLMGLPILCIVACVFYSEVRRALVDRFIAQTDLLKLDAEKKRMEIEFKRANNVIELVRKVEE
jgi:hypothetical protein